VVTDEWCSINGVNPELGAEPLIWTAWPVIATASAAISDIFGTSTKKHYYLGSL
jgi:hypothetical protein